MKLFDITEPNTSKNNNSSNDIAVGIDFGTTNSLISAVIDDKAIILGENGSILSSISFINQEIAIGNSQNNDADLTIKSIKRLLAKTYQELITSESTSQNITKMLFLEDNNIKIRIQDKSFSLVHIAGKIFAYLKSKAELYLHQDVTKAVITVPAHFDDIARNKVKQAAELAGLKILRIINEPTAAAYAYGLENSSKGNYVVYDLGGGTFDVSILRMEMGVFQVLKTSGDYMLGGDDIDIEIINYIKDIFKIDILSTQHEAYLLNQAQKAKELLSSCTQVEILFNGKIALLTQDILKNLAKPLIDKTIKITKTVIELCDNIDINGIILVGGSSRLDYVSESLKSNFSNIPLLCNLDPEKIVAYGAALQAYNLTNNKQNLLIDITPLSLGIEVLGGFIERIIERHTPIPTEVTKYFTTSCDNQTEIVINIIQGERELVSECRMLASIKLALPIAKAGLLQVAVTFSIDADGLLRVKAFESKGANKAEIIVRPLYNLDEDKINEILYEAFQHNESDYLLKKTNELKAKTAIIISNLNNIAKESGGIFSKEEERNLSGLIQLGNNILNSTDIDKMSIDLESLEAGAEKISIKFLDYTISNRLAGKNIEEL